MDVRLVMLVDVNEPLGFELVDPPVTVRQRAHPGSRERHLEPMTVACLDARARNPSAPAGRPPRWRRAG